jgi:hypothetical protein
MIRSLLAVGAAVMTLFGAGASADPLGLIQVSLQGSGDQTCAQRSVTYSGRVTIGPDGLIPGHSRTVAITVDEVVADYATADEEGNFSIDLSIGEDGTRVVQAVVLHSTPLASASNEVETQVTDTDYWTDADGDGFGTGEPICMDEHPGDGWAEDGGDCDDTNPAISPSMDDFEEDGIDQNCDGVDGPE